MRILQIHRKPTDNFANYAPSSAGHVVTEVSYINMNTTDDPTSAIVKRIEQTRPQTMRLINLHRDMYYKISVRTGNVASRLWSESVVVIVCLNNTRKLFRCSSVSSGTSDDSSPVVPSVRTFIFVKLRAQWVRSHGAVSSTT